MLKALKKTANGDLQTKDNFFTVLRELQEQFEAMKPELETTVRDPAMGVEGYIVVWNTGVSKGGPLDGCGKGGTRITPDISMDEVKMLARTMALKNAAAGLPLGGSKSGLRADPKEPGFEQKYRRFVRLCAPALHENGGPFGGFGFDIGANPVHALWACDELGSTRCFTGKPLNMGGTDYDRQGLAGLGVATAGKTLLEVQKENPAKCTYAIQGLGAMGAAVLRYFSETGARLAAIGDPKYGGTWTFKNAISEDLKQALVLQEVEKAKILMEKEGTRLDPDSGAVLYQDVDMLFPCAVQKVIDSHNAYQIKARYISEGANGPVTADAYAKLYEKKILAVPDFIANAGGIIAAFVELTSKSENKVKEAKDYTITRISDNVRRMMELATRFGVEPLHAGQYMALSNIFFGVHEVH
jgi:glutamate dehydrogenase (NAD(P)+)